MSNDDAGNWLGLKDKVVVVTGAASGIGYGIAECFAGVGARVLILDRDAAAAETAAGKLGSGAAGFGCDVSDEAQVRAAAAHLLAEIGPCEVLVNNAGILRPGALATISLADWQALLAVNLTGTFLCSQIFGAQMLRRGRGALVHIASIAARFPQGYSGAYSASKAGVVLLSQGLANEWGPQGVRSNCVSPGNTRSGMTAPILAVPGIEQQRIGMIPTRRIADPCDMGHVAMFLASDRSSYVNGENITVDGGFGRTLLDLFPRPGYRRDEVLGNG